MARTAVAQPDAPLPASPDAAAREPAGAAAAGRLLLLAAVFTTGATALAYEVAWTRGLVLLLGSTATTTAVLLGTFVGALGLGARWGGGLAERSPRPLRLYGLLEIGAAALAVLALPLSRLLEGPYVAVASGAPEPLRFVLRVAVAVLVVAPPALLLGATLPALVRQWVRHEGQAGRGTAWVYGTNTVGAVLGCLLAGFVSVEHLGVDGTLALAAGIGGGVGLAATAAASLLAPRTVSPPALLAAPSPPGALAAAFLCGFVGLGAEVAGFRVLVFFLEGFTVTFAAMLAVFIAGLGVGSLLLGPPLARTARPWRALGFLLAAAAGALFLGLLVVVPELEGWMKALKAALYRGVDSSEGIARALAWSSLAGASLLLLAPALALGATFPLCVRWAELDGAPAGRAVGRVYAWNSLGTLLAPFLLGFLWIPWAGVPRAWAAMAWLALLAAAALLAWSRLPPRLRVAALLGALLLAGPLATLPLPGSAPRDLVAASFVLRARPGRTLRAVRTDAVTTASVVEEASGERVLYTDDFAAAATGPHYRYMRMLGHLPVLLADRAEHAMVIAFGTGTTAGAVAAHPRVGRIEVIEVSRGVLALAPWFTDANRRVLADPRVVPVVDDGRNALLLHPGGLDVITLEPLMPYAPQGLPFYTREFYALAKERLAEGGVLCQWLPVHAMEAGLYAALLRTFFDVFPDGSLWFFEQSTALIGRKGGGGLPDLATLQARMEPVREDLTAAGVGTVDLLLAAWLAGGERVRTAQPPPSAYDGREVSDRDPFPEFHPTPRAPLSTPWLGNTLNWLAGLVDRDGGPGEGAAPRLREAAQRGLFGRWREAYATWREAGVHGLAPGSPERIEGLRESHAAWREAAGQYEQALLLLPGDPVLAWRRARADRAAARVEVTDAWGRASASGDDAQARTWLGRAEARARAAAALEDGDPVAARRAEASLLHAAALLRLGRCEAARRALEAGRGALPPGEGRDLLGRALRALATWIAQRGAPQDADLAPWFAGAAPCRPRGVAPLAPLLAPYDEALAGTRRRVQRLAADNLLAAARAEGLEEDLVHALRERPVPPGDRAGAVHAALLEALEPEAPELGLLLGRAQGGALREALAEAGRRRLLRRHLARARALGAHDDPHLRAAVAEAVGEDGARALLSLLPDLLGDPERDVRVAAGAALHRHRPDLAAPYGPDLPAARREEVVASIRRALR